MTTINRKDDSEFGSIIDVRLEGLTLRVADVWRSIEFYGNKLGFTVEINKAPQFAMIRVGGPTGGTIGGRTGTNCSSPREKSRPAMIASARNAATRPAAH